MPISSVRPSGDSVDDTLDEQGTSFPRGRLMVPKLIVLKVGSAERAPASDSLLITWYKSARLSAFRESYLAGRQGRRRPSGMGLALGVAVVTLINLIRYR